ncbi:MAG: hypothetical protein BAJATHORv1_100077 [Candidatus Thorarchaeota archaeon]|nr:MAG: hypothetical protein BAJATHORv1_100077 [Candidatus Thorarchaeota archaeon]
MNRSYLAALMVADEIIRLRGVTTQLGGFYSKIEENLLRVGVDPLIRDLIADLKERRLVADYRYNQHISKKNAEESLQISEYIVKTLDEF